jgi:hypothetical protein
MFVVVYFGGACGAVWALCVSLSPHSPRLPNACKAYSQEKSQVEYESQVTCEEKIKCEETSRRIWTARQTSEAALCFRIGDLTSLNLQRVSPSAPSAPMRQFGLLSTFYRKISCFNRISVDVNADRYIRGCP